jgi:ABC-type multidrug transport system fused ATPase/permease subunit
VTAAEWYRTRSAFWTARRDRHQKTADILSKLRLVTFLGGVALIWWSLASLRDGAQMGGAVAGVGLLVAFGALVVRHARVLESIAQSEAAMSLAAQGLARLARNWAALPDVPRPGGVDWDAHPYLRDLDLYGHASVTKWLGPAATYGGTRQLQEWLLTPAPAAAVHERQQAVGELASKREWRESLAIHGRLSGTVPDDISRFLAWAEDTAPALPAFMQPLAVGLTSSTLILVAVWLAGAMGRLPPLTGETVGLWLADALTHGWFWFPVVVNVMLSFALAGRVAAVFDRATLGQRALERVAAMLAAVCDEPWQASRLLALQARLRAGGSAPDFVRRLGRLGGWSELRTGAALLHFPIQALTLWDLHVVFALQRWRRQCGSHVRGWLEALGECDALSVLSIIRADEPAWAIPVIDPLLREVTASDIGHPLMPPDRRIDNNLSVGPAGTLVLITGSNMSGKSTLLRSIGINLVLAQAGAPVCAASFRMPPVRLHTSIHIEDSLALGLSYFMAALARLKQIVDAAELTRDPERVLFYLLDEVLQGTNSVERGLAVRAVARHLLDAGAIGVMTTHDLALADEEPIKSAATLAHFTEQVHPDGTMTFDYRLRPGLATSTNALRLMQLIGITQK